MSAWEEQLAKLTPAKRALLERMRQEAASKAPVPGGIRKRAQSGPAPLSFAQQRLWLVHQLDPESYLFNVPRGFRLQGPLDVAALEASLTEIVRRHEVLRTTFAGEAGSLVQVVGAAAPIRLDASEIGFADALEHAGKEFRRHFDLASGPLLRARLWRLGEDDHILFLVMHHIVSDAWTAAILFDEMAALYEAFAAGKPSPLPDLPVQYADYAAWQREQLSEERLDAELSWWMRQLEGAPPALALRADAPRPTTETSRGALEVAHIPKPLLESLRELSQQEGTTLFMTLMAGYTLLLSRYSGLDDIVVGTDFSTRTHVEVERLIGFFINLLPIRTRVAGSLTFRQLMGSVKEAALGAYAHPDLPFERLVEELKPERVPSRHPLVQILLVMQNIPRPKQEMAGLRVSPFEIPFNTSKFDLAVFLEEKPDGINGQWVYLAELFTPATIHKMARHFENLLASAVANPDARLSTLQMLSETERREQEEEERRAKQSKSKRLMMTSPLGIGIGSRKKP